MQKQLSKPTNNCGSYSGTKFLRGPVATVFASTRTGTWRVVRPVVEQELCIFCGTCQKYCPTDVISIHKDEQEHNFQIDFDYCKGCGICASVCPKDCITMVSERGA